MVKKNSGIQILFDGEIPKVNEGWDLMEMENPRNLNPEMEIDNTSPNSYPNLKIYISYYMLF